MFDVSKDLLLNDEYQIHKRIYTTSLYAARGKQKLNCRLPRPPIQA
jgi:hypothetical protein